MSTGTALIAALEILNQSVAGIENTITKLEQRPKGKRGRDNQMDLFSAPAPVATASPAPFEVQDISRRLNRAIAQIETVLGTAQGKKVAS